MQSHSKALASVREVLAEIADDGPGCAIGVIEAGDTLLAECRGLASLEYGAPITPASRFYLASVSKQVTALSTLLAAESGAFDLDGSIRRIISELPAYMDNVTVRHLLTHTGGVRDYFSLGFLSGLSAEHVYSDDEVLELSAASAPSTSRPEPMVSIATAATSFSPSPSRELPASGSTPSRAK